MISQLRRKRLAGLTFHVCRFREEESTHAASRRERPQNAPRHRGRPSPWAQGWDGFVLTIFHKSNPSTRVPFLALAQDFIGCGGWGGSISVWDPKRKLSVAYAMNGMSTPILGGPRARKILSALQAKLPCMCDC